MKRIILILALALSFSSLRVEAIEPAPIEMTTVDQNPIISMGLATVAIGVGAFLLTEHYLLRKKVRELANQSALQQQLECESLHYKNFEAMKKELNTHNPAAAAAVFIAGLGVLIIGIIAEFTID